MRCPMTMPHHHPHPRRRTELEAASICRRVLPSALAVEPCRGRSVPSGRSGGTRRRRRPGTSARPLLRAAPLPPNAAQPSREPRPPLSEFAVQIRAGESPQPIPDVPLSTARVATDRRTAAARPDLSDVPPHAAVADSSAGEHLSLSILSHQFVLCPVLCSFYSCWDGFLFWDWEQGMGSWVTVFIYIPYTEV
ncbi:leucine-rich repeat extensin-like protein 7 [Iris pallida]|uniref:Leucine-rich repeat extensin-like protein 7 n=1 Tax=Iris pallida TaxID=29817 RepID=A0AAX6EZ97_IRIPA|nr:leucine-rich repeat extensin-like protein 7 [Iris pallida]